jgi:hypothetical protein
MNAAPDAPLPADRDNAQVTIADDVLLPEGTRLLHIGPHKTGTTTLQGAFHAARRKVARQGVLYASTNRQAIQAVRAVAGRASPYTGGKVPAEAHWTNLVAGVEGSSAKRILISSETFADAPPKAVRRIVDELDPSLVHVVATLRPLARILPSQWQQYVQNGLARTYDEWLKAIFTEPDQAGTPSFWHRHRHDRLIARWAEIVGPEKVTVVLVDERDHDASLRTFERLLGLQAGTLQPAEGIYNRSLTRAEVELVRAMHAASSRLGLDKGLRLNIVFHGAAANMKLREPGRDEPRVETPLWAQEQVSAAAREIVAGIAGSGVRVIGDLETLVEAPKPTGTREAEVAAEAWSAGVGRALMGVLVQTGLTRGGRASTGDDWPDGEVAIVRNEPRAAAEVLANSSTSRLTSQLFGRVRSTVPSWMVRPLNVVRRALVGGRPRRGGAARGGRARRPSIDLATGQREQRRAHELEEAE